MNEKFDWKKYLTLDNIERYAPVAAFFPIGMSIVTRIVGVVLSIFLDGLQQDILYATSWWDC